MPTVTLLSITPALAGALDTPDVFEQTYQLCLGPHHDLTREIVAQDQAFRRTTGAPPAWGGYLMVDAATRAVVGVGGYKGAPDAEEVVEVAYFTFPAFEGRGYGGATAAALVAQARASAAVRVVRAHTLPAPSASTRILERLGFAPAGTVVDDPADGPVWRWLLALGGPDGAALPA